MLEAWPNSLELYTCKPQRFGNGFYFRLQADRMWRNSNRVLPLARVLIVTGSTACNLRHILSTRRRKLNRFPERSVCVCENWEDRHCLEEYIKTDGASQFFTPSTLFYSLLSLFWRNESRLMSLPCCMCVCVFPLKSRYVYEATAWWKPFL